MCTSRGSDALHTTLRTNLDARTDHDRCRLLRGGCYGLCDLGPNVVVRSYESAHDVPSADVDRLTLTARDNETVYVAVRENDLVPIVHAHLDNNTRAHDVTREVREPNMEPAAGSVAARMRALRHARAHDDDETLKS